MTAPRLTGAAALAEARRQHAAETGFKARARRASPELDVQTHAMELARLQLAPSVIWAAVLNERDATVQVLRKLKAAGLTTGFPDTIAIWEGGAAFVEFKSPPGDPRKKRSAAQAEIHDRLWALGWPVLTTNDAQCAVDWLIEQGAPRR